jgi:hypothetical protein
VIGLASPANHEWLASHGVTGVAYGDGVADRILAASGGHVDAFIDTIGGDYVELALSLGVKPDRIDTIANFEAKEKYGVKIDGNAAGSSAGVLAELAGLIDQGQLEIPTRTASSRRGTPAARSSWNPESRAAARVQGVGRARRAVGRAGRAPAREVAVGPMPGGQLQGEPLRNGA